MFVALRQDLRYAVRQLIRSPGFTAIAVLTLGLGIGANTAIFSVVNAVLLRPLPYPEPSRLVSVAERRPNGTTNVVSFPNFLDWRKDGVLEAVALGRTLSFNVGGAEGPERIAGALVSADYFKVLGLAPAAGRYFLQGEDTPGKDGVAIIGHGLWESRFGGDPGVVGRTPQRFNLMLLGGFAALALVLAAVGVYGIVAYTVSGRTREIGIRMALGAAGRDVGRAIMGPALRPSVAGIAIGIAGAVLIGRSLAPDLYEVKPHDPLTFALVALILLGAAAVACAIPARRASRVDPAIALRSE